MSRMSRRFPPLLMLTALPILALQGCGDSGVVTPEGSSTVTLSVQGLAPVAGGLNYQAWLVHDGGGSTFGFPLVVFNINETGQMVDPVADTVLSGPYPADVGPAASLGVTISLELTKSLLERSSYTFILSGEFIQGTANLTAEDFFALNRDYSTAEGGFILATPTDEDPNNELSGVWFMDPTSGSTVPGLVLPPSPNGWIYEGWVRKDDKAISTGRFVSSADADSTAFFSGAQEAPLYPGEDFLFNPPQGFDFPLDLSGASVFVTLEPWHELNVYPDRPFFLRVLEGQVPALPLPGTLYTMNSQRSQFPTGTATIQ